MSGGPLGAILERKLAWHGVFVIGVASLVVAALKAWWVNTPALYRSPPAPMLTPPAASPVMATKAPAPRAKPSVSPIVRTVPPSISFTPSRIAPAPLPPELSGLERPPPDPPPYEPPIAVQPGYVIPQEPQPRDIR